jgi:hypothetical protein
MSTSDKSRGKVKNNLLKKLKSLQDNTTIREAIIAVNNNNCDW